MYLKKSLIAGAIAVAALGSSAMAATVTVTITNNSPTNGLNLTPLFVAFHNGDYDGFDVGSAVSAGTEEVAELGSTAGAIAEALAATGGTAVADTVFGNAFGAPVIDPGETATITLDIDRNDNRFFSYLSMVIPSNDIFIGNSNAIEVFGENGVYLGDRTFEITGERIYDAGTEINDFNNGPAFVAGVDATLGIEENGVVTLSDAQFGFIDGELVLLPPGTVLDPSLVDFVTDRAGFSLATITLSAAPVPVPALAPALAVALGSGFAWRRRSKKTASA